MTSLACGDDACRCQASGTSSRPSRSISTRSSPAAACAAMLPVGGGLALLAGACSSCSRAGRPAWRGSPPRSAWPRRPPTGRVARAARTASGRDRRERGRAPQRVEDEVVAVAAGRLAQRGRSTASRVAAERDVASAPSRAGALEPVRVARRGDDPARAEQPRRLHARSGPTTPLAPRTARSRRRRAGRATPARARRRGRRRRGRPRAPGRGRRAPGSRRRRRSASARRTRRTASRRVLEVDERAVRAPADALLAGDVGRLVALERERARWRCGCRSGSSPRPATSSTSAPSAGAGSSKLAELGDGAVRAQDRRLASPGYYDPPSAWTTPRSPTTTQGLVPCVIQDWHSRRGADARVHERRGARRARARTGELHLWSRSRDELWHKGATSGNTQAVRAIRYDCDGDALLALVEPGRPRLPHRRAHLLPPRRARAAGAARGPARRSSARSPRRAAERARGLLHRAAARRPAVRRREGAGGGRGGRPRRPRGDATSASPRRPPTCSTTSPCCCARAASRSPTPRRCCVAVAAESELRLGVRPALERGARARRPSTTSSRSRQTFLEDCETPVSAFLKLRGAGPGVPARVRRAGPARRAAGRSSATGRAASALEPRRRRRPVRARRRRGRAPPPGAAARTCRRSPAARSASSATTACAPSSRSARRTRTPIGLPDLALMLTDALVAFDHLKHTVTILANAYVEEEGVEARLRARARRDRRGARAARRPAAAARPAPTGAGAASSSRTCRARRSRRWSRGSSSTCTPATPSRSCRRSAGRPRSTSTRSRSTAGCGRSTRRRTCTSSTSRTSRSSARRPSRS